MKILREFFGGNEIIDLATSEGRDYFINDIVQHDEVAELYINRLKSEDQILVNEDAGWEYVERYSVIAEICEVCETCYVKPGDVVCESCDDERRRLDASRSPFHNRSAGILDQGASPPTDLLGKQVEVVMDRGNPLGVIRGKLLSFADSGQFIVQDEMGFTHWCWPMLEIRRGSDE